MGSLLVRFWSPSSSYNLRFVHDSTFWIVLRNPWSVPGYAYRIWQGKTDKVGKLRWASAMVAGILGYLRVRLRWTVPGGGSELPAYTWSKHSQTSPIREDPTSSRHIPDGKSYYRGLFVLVSKYVQAHSNWCPNHVCSIQGSIQIKIQIKGCPNPTTNQSPIVSESIRPNNSNTNHQYQYLINTNQYPFEDHRQSKRGIREGSNPRKGTEIPKRYDSKS